MKWLTRVLGFLFLPGGGRNKVQQGSVVEAVAEAADSMVYTKQEQATDDAQDVASARAFVVAPSHGTLWDAMIDGWNRSIRPAFATWVFGLLTGLWSVPAEKWRAIPAEAWAIITTVLIFFFGGRALMKDVFPGIAAMVRAVRK